MSSRYSANQFENAFRANRLQNWSQDTHTVQRVTPQLGRTAFIADARGHLLPGKKKKRGSAWPDFRGTWDVPSGLPPGNVDPTARSEEGLRRLQSWRLCSQRSGVAPPGGGGREPQAQQSTSSSPQARVGEPAAASHGSPPHPPRDSDRLLCPEQEPAGGSAAGERTCNLPNSADVTEEGGAGE